MRLTFADDQSKINRRKEFIFPAYLFVSHPQRHAYVVLKIGKAALRSRSGSVALDEFLLCVFYK